MREQQKVLRANSAVDQPLLSLILCSRNDQYMGNSRWRLETALNYAARRVHELGFEKQVEIVLTDWGSEIPLQNAIQLTPEAAALVTFVNVPPTLVRTLQKDSSFAEVLALNAAARRSKGLYIGRIDQDTLVGARFLEFFFDLMAGKEILPVPVEKALMFSNQRMVPFRFTSRCPSFATVEKFIDRFGRRLTMEHRNSKSDFYTAGVGIWLIHRDLWFECEGYDESMIYMNAMETNMVRRLLMKYSLVNLGQLISYDFYHQEHYHPHAVRKSSTLRKVNPRFPYSEPTKLKPNGEDWGLAKYSLEIRHASSSGKIDTKKSNFREALAFESLLVKVGFRLLVDIAWAAGVRWKHRVMVVRQTIGSEPIARWPFLLKQRLAQRKLAQTSR